MQDKLIQSIDYAVLVIILLMDSSLQFLPYKLLVAALLIKNMYLNSRS